MRIIAIANQKGGCGKTTTAINLSTFLAIAGKKILLIDIDPQGNATSGLGIDKATLAASIYNVILDQLSPNNATVQTQIQNLSLIPSNISLTGAEIELVGIMGREYKLKKALAEIRDAYDFILIDCPPSLGLLTINALSAANSALIPIQCEYYALEGLGQLMNTVNLVKENLNPELEIEGVLLTMADYRTNLTNEVIAEVKRYFSPDGSSAGQNSFSGAKVYNSIIPRNIRLTEAPGFGKPVFLYDKHSIGSQKYQDFADEMLGVKKESELLSVSEIKGEIKDGEEGPR